jgi:hypothetical protein
MTRTDPTTQVRRTLGALRLGVPHAAGGLALLPVIGGEPGAAYLTAGQAIAEGSLSIGELGAGVVPELLVQNLGALPVLLLDGEHLEGAWQDRILNTTVLLAARRETPIPVSCVERGRWGAASSRGRSRTSDALAFAELRGKNATRVVAAARSGRGRQTDQGEVWSEVERKRAEVGGGPSPTAAMRDAFGDRREELERIRRSFVAPGPAQTGVLAVAGSRVLALDVFDRPSTLAAYWDRLVRGYALDALRAERATSADAAFAAGGFWGEVTHPESDATQHEGVGLGIEVILTTSRSVAHALVWDGAVVHLSAFPSLDGPDADRTRPRAGRISRPSARTPDQGAWWFHGSKEKEA